jgi:hypothetical protein
VLTVALSTAGKFFDEKPDKYEDFSISLMAANEILITVSAFYCYWVVPHSQTVNKI